MTPVNDREVAEYLALLFSERSEISASELCKEGIESPARTLRRPIVLSYLGAYGFPHQAPGWHPALCRRAHRGGGEAGRARSPERR